MLYHLIHKLFLYEFEFDNNTALKHPKRFVQQKVQLITVQ